MAHCIHGFIARLGALQNWAVSLPGARVVPLALGFAFLPVTRQLAGDEEMVAYPLLDRLTIRLAAWAEEASHVCKLAYIETDYFGGVGTQSAVVWHEGRIAYGPEQSKNHWVDGQYVKQSLLDKAVNQAVRLIGVDRGAAIDEFAALGLDRHRSNERWLSEVASG